VIFLAINKNKLYIYIIPNHANSPQKSHYTTSERKKQQERTNVQPKNNTQKHKHTNGGHKIELWGAAKGGRGNNLCHTPSSPIS